MINQDRMIFGDFSVNSVPISLNFCRLLLYHLSYSLFLSLPLLFSLFPLSFLPLLSYSSASLSLYRSLSLAPLSPLFLSPLSLSSHSVSLFLCLLSQTRFLSPLFSLFTFSLLFFSLFLVCFLSLIFSLILLSLS